MNPNYLQHVGVLGMRWGVRKAVRNFGSARKEHFKRSVRQKYGTKLNLKENFKKSLKQKYGDIKPESIAKGKKMVGTVISAYAIYTAAKFTGKYLKTSAAIIRG